jgi:uncharacterized protein YjbI with pentapeptide repeats
MAAPIPAQSSALDYLTPEPAPELGPPPLAERLAAVPPSERTAVLLAAVARGEPLALAGADLRGIDLRPGPAVRADGAGRSTLVPAPVVLDGADLRGATLSGGCLAQASLRGACLDGALLVGTDLRGADLSGATLRRASLAGADLARSDLSFANLHGASLLTANLAEVTATGADFQEGVLHAASLPRAILRGADLRWAHLDSANLSGAALDGARFEGASLTLTNLSGARLSAGTDFGYAFLHQARLDRTGLTRAHLGVGIGEAFTDLGLAEGTYRGLERAFAAEGRAADARWAHRQALAMATASHRPDQAWRYFGRAEQREGRDPARRPSLRRRAAFRARHTLIWLAGVVADLTTGYGTSPGRALGSLMAVWLVFALLYAEVAGVSYADGQPAGWLGLLAFSAAALTPIDADPLEAISAAARALSFAEGIIGLVLLGALGAIGVGRLRS